MYIVSCYSCFMFFWDTCTSTVYPRMDAWIGINDKVFELDIHLLELVPAWYQTKNCQICVKLLVYRVYQQRQEIICNKNSLRKVVRDKRLHSRLHFFTRSAILIKSFFFQFCYFLCFLFFFLITSLILTTYEQNNTKMYEQQYKN